MVRARQLLAAIALLRQEGRLEPPPSLYQTQDRFDEVLLTLLRDGGDIRLFNGHVPPWPQARRAAEQGQALARQLGVPFHFTSPGTPDIDLPRWWDTQPG